MTRQELLAQVLTPDKVPEREPYPAIYCYECGRQLRSVDGIELEDIHTGEDGEDVCEDCCAECSEEVSG